MGGHNFGNNYQDGYAAQSYEYKPKWEKDVERHPDKLASSNRLLIEDHESRLNPPVLVEGWDNLKTDVIAVMEVRGLGVIVMKGCHSTHAFHGISIITEDEMKFDA